tara:strand:- start:2582 stop:2863 length:282 start_codon:yes stop_codon:yes gene_type:complete
MTQAQTLYTFERWKLEVDSYQDEDRFERTTWTAVSWAGRRVLLDMPSLGGGPTEAQFRKMVAMDFPTRVAAGKIGPLLGPDIDMLYEQLMVAA